jgi:hypothetical protein
MMNLVRLSVCVVATATAVGIGVAAIPPEDETPASSGAPASMEMSVALRDKAARDFKAIANAYRDAQSLSIESEHRVFAEYSARVAIETERSVLHRRGERLYNDALGSVTVITDSLIIQVNADEQRMIVSRVGDMAPDAVLPGDIQIEESLDLCDSIAYADLGSGRARYRLWYGGEMEVRSMDIEFVRATRFIQRTVLYMSATTASEGGPPHAPRVEVTYRQLVDSPETAHLLDEQRYLARASAAVLACSDRYSGFELIDLRVGGGK